jgi:hypothetical protein
MQHVEIRVKERLDAHWAEWLDGFTLIYTAENETIITGSILDQAALYGLIGKLRNLGVMLVSVSIEPPSEPC